MFLNIRFHTISHRSLLHEPIHLIYPTSHQSSETMGMSSELSEHAQNRRDAFNFAPSNISPQTLPRTRDLTRHRFSIAGFDHLMRSQRNESDSTTHPYPTFSELETYHDADDRPTKRRQRSSKSFSSIKPANLHCLKASYQAVKANAKQKFQTVGLYKRRATSHDTSERPVLQRPRSLFGLRPSTSGVASKMIAEKQEDTSHGLNPLLQGNPTPWTQLSGAAARQSAREFGKAPISSRSRDDSAFGEHRVQQNDNRESGISLVTELENLHIDDASQLVSVPDIYRYGKNVCLLGSKHCETNQYRSFPIFTSRSSRGGAILPSD